MRHDIHGKDGLTPSRSSASTLTQSTTASSSLGSLGPRPSGHGTGTGGLQMEQEQEVNFRIIWYREYVLWLNIHYNYTVDFLRLLPNYIIFAGVFVAHNRPTHIRGFTCSPANAARVCHEFVVM